MELSQPSDESKVLIIYTGGTIGMLVGQQGYVPEPHFLTETLRSQTRFHDPLQDSLFSNASTVEGFREWTSTSGHSTPLSSSFQPTSYPGPSGLRTPGNPSTTPTLVVRSSRSIDAPTPLYPTVHQPHFVQPSSRKVAEGVYEAQLPSLVTPRTSVTSDPTGKRIRYAVLEWNPLLDSSNIEMTDWVRVATEVELNYSFFDAFVVLHGTDTMAYSASALSFLLEDLGKTVILTGAQIPLSQLRNDAVENLLGALSIAGNYIIPECCLFFNHTLYRGNRVSKASSYDFNAFNSPNFPPLVNVGIDIVVNWNDVIRQTSLRRFRAHKTMCPYVATLRLFPGITAATVRAFLMPPTRGVVLETFGAGNAPQRPDLMSAFKQACDQGMIIVAISQCAKGTVSDAYETGRTLLQAGIVPGGDMTPECALTKLSYLLSKPELSIDEIRKLISTPLRGEVMAPSRFAPSHPITDENFGQVQNLLSRLVVLSGSPSRGPKIVVSNSQLEETVKDATASWSWTAGEAASTQAALLPLLIHLAVARDDVNSLEFCLKRPVDVDPLSSPALDLEQHTVAGGLANCLEPTALRSPLHVAALNGSTSCMNLLLASGALVHSRDSLGHTALYYAARQGHETVVNKLLVAGASLGGLDIEGFAAVAQKRARQNGDQVGMRIWDKVVTSHDKRQEK